MRMMLNYIFSTELLIFFWAILFLIGTLFLILFFIRFILLTAFSRRFDFHPKLKYFTIKDFPDMEMDSVEFKNQRGYFLRGGFYYNDQIQPHKKLMIFSHGIGPGHQAYTHLIHTFVKKGYVVFAYDNMGCGLSEGKSIKGIPQAIHDLRDALMYVEKTTYANLPKTLLGHSWGAYAVLRAARMKFNVTNIISITPFNDVGEMLGKYIPWIKRFKLFVKLNNLSMFGKLSIMTSSEILSTTKIKTLVIVGEKDDDIPLKGNYDLFIQSQNPLSKVYLAKNHRHNPYLSSRAETYVIDTILKGTEKLAKEKDNNVLNAFFQSLDYQLVGEHDSHIIEMIEKF
jgi:pimeloyl-ACP methyl ester carboxylesterase